MTKPNVGIKPEQLDQLQKIGSNLRQLRQKHEMTIEEVAAKTRIQPRLLKAIEEGKVDILPESVYVKGMVKRYGDSLGVDGHAIAENVPYWQRSFIRLRKQTWQKLPIGLKIKPIHIYLGYVILVAGSIGGLSQLLNQSNRSNSIITSTYTYQQPKTEPLIPIQQPQLTNNPTSSSTIATKTPEIRIGVNIKFPAWVKVVVDGKTQFEGTLTAGEKRDWVAKKELTLITTNGGGVVLTENGKSPRVLGDQGKRQEVSFRSVQKP